MDRQLKSPLLIETIGQPLKLSSEVTFKHLQNFLEPLGPSPARTQLERLTDALGVEIGKILPAEGERRELERKEVRIAAKSERRRLRAEAEEQANQDQLENQIENDLQYQDGVEGEGELENGAVELDDEEKMDDRGDIEYGDNVEDENDDEPDDHEDQKMEDNSE
ncbi:uncharacterized protein IL334_002502 [Kwoniella shivajii]|uniref:Uncharacterized protein n=1 Tax=Kwoniella shivajii TaxID=564305 RepID=A0ABZ1CUX6_9TREE|nr:hypothetical protein IL334_002502 [Kwoniella shivajii]